MFQFEIKDNEAGQRFDKYLHKLLPKAPTSFFYKMLRKKNIVLNGKKAEGKEKLSVGDTVSLFLSEETFQGFLGNADTSIYLEAYKRFKNITVLYENEHMLLVSKPSGVLSQKAKDTDYSVNEWLIGYLLDKHVIDAASLSTYKPSVCNRLDRNTSGIVLCAKTLAGSQELSHMIATRKIRKYYRLFVKGIINKEVTLDGFLIKDHDKNHVSIISSDDIDSNCENASYIKTRYYPINILSELSYVEVELITGKTHQIRAHMASIGHPLLGDYKYGDKIFNDKYQDKYKIKSQLLHAYRLEFPQNALLTPDGAMTFTADEPAIFRHLLSIKNNTSHRAKDT